MPKDDLNYKFTENGIVYDFYDVFVPAENFRQPALWTWGNNAIAQLGSNSTTSTTTPNTTFAGGTTWKQIDVGSPNSSICNMVAIKTDGTLWTWGFGNDTVGGMLGNNATTTRSTPVTTFAGGNNWKQVSAGGVHAAAIKTDGTLWVWGGGNGGVLGTNNTGINQGVRKLTPVTTFAGGNNWKQVSCGNGHTAAIKTDGSLWIWGDNSEGRLGTNGGGTKITPVTTFAGGNNWKQVDCGFNHTTAIKTDGSLWVWGANNLGQLGINNTTSKSTPVTTFVGGNNWKSSNAGIDDAPSIGAIKTDGTLWVWGPGRFIGVNNVNIIPTPTTTFAGGNNWKQVSMGSITMGLKTDGTLWDTRNDFFTFQQRYTTANNWKSVSSSASSIAAIKYVPDP